MSLWTDILNPVEATAAARVELADYELSQGTLGRWLPNIAVDDDYVEVYATDDGLVTEAHFRAWNAPAEVGEGQAVNGVRVKLPAISRNEPIDEKTQKALRRLPDDRVRRSVEAAIRRNVRATADALERTRGGLLQTGVVANPWQKNFKLNDDYQRDTALTVDAGAGNYWNDQAVDRIGQVQDWITVWKQFNLGQTPGAILFSDQSFAGYARGSEFATVLPGGATRPGSQADVEATSQTYGFPSLEKYNRATKSGLVLDPKYVFILPAAGDVESTEPTLLGATYFGETLTAQADGFEAVSDSDPSGLVAGIYKEDRIPYTVEAMSDACAAPVAHNANAVMAIKVFA